MSSNKNFSSDRSSGNGSLDSMARRYKDEMMRIYRMNGNTAQGNEAADPPQQQSCSRNTGDSACRFMTAEEIIENQPAMQQSGGNSGDITENLINGASQSPSSLTAGGVVNNDTNSRNSSGQTIYVPNNTQDSQISTQSSDTEVTSDGNNGSAFRGLMINPAIIGTADSSNIVSNVLSELMPSFSFPPDIEVGEAVPKSISPAFVILNSWFNLTGDNGWGYLQFEVTTGSLGNPVQYATVVISRIVNNQRLLTRIIKTDAAGVTKTICLPAPTYYQHASPYVSNITRPFAEYSASVYANNYYPVTNINIMIEAGIKSVQPVDMVPLPGRRPLPGIMPRSSD